MKLLTFFFCLVIASQLHAQKPSNSASLEFNPYLRYDKYPPIEASSSPTSYSTLEMTGSGFGANLFYHFPTKRSIHFRLGMGYYRYSFTDITLKQSGVAVGYHRAINYIGMGDVINATNKYWYNTLSLTAGAQKRIVNHQKFEMNAGVLAQYFYSFSQYYQIVDEPPAGPPHQRFTQKHRRSFALSVSVDLNLLYHLSQFSIGPTLQLPVYDRWQQDQIFLGESGDNRSKWLRGIAPGLSIQYRL